MTKILLACLAAGAITGTAFAKLPPGPPMTDVQKAEKAAKDKASAEKEEAMLEKTREKAVANYKKGKGVADAKPATVKKK